MKRFMQQTHRCKTSLQGAWIGFKMMTNTDAMSDEMFFGCFASAEYILLTNNEILQAYVNWNVMNGVKLNKKINYGHLVL